MAMPYRGFRCRVPTAWRGKTGAALEKATGVPGSLFARKRPALPALWLQRQWAVQEGTVEFSPTRHSWLVLLLFSYADASGGIVGCKTFLGAVQLAVATVQPATGGAS